jgi:hypothetical protein
VEKMPKNIMKKTALNCPNIQWQNAQKQNENAAHNYPNIQWQKRPKTK